MGNKCVPPEKANVNCRQAVLETGLEGGAHSHMPPPGRELVLQEQGLRVGVRVADKAWRKRWEESREENQLHYRPLSHRQRENAPGEKGDRDQMMVLKGQGCSIFGARITPKGENATRPSPAQDGCY